MALATWWTGDALPDVRPLPGFSVSTEIDAGALAALNRISIDEVMARRSDGHVAYVGFVDGTPVTYGWVATEAAEIGELNLRFSLPSGDHYLWDFATLPEWQGRGLYSKLLRAILEAESATAERFWIIYAPENLPSGAGMQKAGFSAVGRLSFSEHGGVALTVADQEEPRSVAGARVLGVTLVSEALSPCWRCHTGDEAAGACTCGSSGMSHDTCACAIQLRPSVQTVPAALIAVGEVA